MIDLWALNQLEARVTLARLPCGKQVPVCRSVRKTWFSILTSRLKHLSTSVTKLQTYIIFTFIIPLLNILFASSFPLKLKQIRKN